MSRGIKSRGKKLEENPAVSLAPKLSTGILSLLVLSHKKHLLALRSTLK